MPSLANQTVVVIGGSAGIGLETARAARAEGAEVIITGRDPDRLKQAAAEVDARSTAAFDANDPARLEGFFAGLSGPIDQVLVTAGGPYYGLLADLDLDDAARYIGTELTLPLRVGRAAIGKVNRGGTLLFVSGTGARRPAPGLALTTAMSVALPALIAGLALEIAPIRVNVIAPGFVDTPLSARLLGDDLDARRQQLRDTLPIGRVVGPEDVAALAVHLMTNTALNGATYDIDGGQQFVR
jgi:NAD(P)-dependent dehydrogenase (short-subunit alcohol dehydrogenase family)